MEANIIIRYQDKRHVTDESSSLLVHSVSDEETKTDTWCQCYKTFFSSLLTTRPSTLECLYLAITFQSSLTFAGNTRSLPKKEASESSSNWVCSGLALKF
jgi:hypothetical protein